MYRPIDGRTIEVNCDSCASTFTTGRGEDGEPDEILCSKCHKTLADLRDELAHERDRVWFETFLSFPFKQLPAPAQPGVLRYMRTGCEYCDSPAHDIADCSDLKAWREHQDLMDAADQAAYYSPKWEENR